MTIHAYDRALTPLVSFPEGGDWQVLDLEGGLLFQGEYEACGQYMVNEGLRPHCNCELVDTFDEGAWLSQAKGWA